MNTESFHFDPRSYLGLEKLGRIRLSPSFHMREFLYSEIAVEYQIRNVPDAGRVADAVSAGRQLCHRLLEPLQQAFGRIHIRSGYRSRAVNQAGVKKHNCASNNDGVHTWEYPKNGHGAGATACISIPSVSKAVLAGEATELAMAWWIHDHMKDWSFIEVFATPRWSDEVAFNIGWHEVPMKVILNRRGGPLTLSDRLPSPQEREDAWRTLIRATSLRGN